MQVGKDTVVTLAYSVTDPDRNVVDAGDQPISYLQGGYDGIFPKIEAALEGKTIGHTITISLEPDEAFGDYDAELIRMVDLSELPPDAHVGMHFEETVNEDDEPMIFLVTDIAEDKAILDGNHPLAGIRLLFSCTITGIRPASPEEILAETADSLSIEVTPAFGRA